MANLLVAGILLLGVGAALAYIVKVKNVSDARQEAVVPRKVAAMESVTVEAVVQKNKR